MTTVEVDLQTDRIVDWDSFHSACKDAFGFPEFYGRNLDAWIDCMSYLDDSDEMTTFHLKANEVLNIRLTDSDNFRLRAPGLFEAIIDCTAAVNKRYIERDMPISISITLQ